MDEHVRMCCDLDRAGIEYVTENLDENRFRVMAESANGTVLFRAFDRRADNSRHSQQFVAELRAR